MNKTVLFVLTILILAACSAPPTNREATSSANTNKAAETKSAAPLTEAEASAKEKEVWASIEKKDSAAFGAYLVDDFIYVSGDGVHDKAATVKRISDAGTMSNLVFSDWKLVSVDKDAAVLVYKFNANAAMNGQTQPVSSYASTLMVNRSGKWQAIYHQDCDVSTAPPPPAKASTPSTSASPAAAASPATMSSNVEANEKAVWAALTARHWDLFAGYLANDAVEVEPLGVSDKAGSVKGVQAFDFSKSSLSDWKTVKIDDDAAIVTYVAHFPGQKPDTEYHTTVWANRNGKWSAVFHHGTPKAAPPPAPAKSAKK